LKFKNYRKIYYIRIYLILKFRIWKTKRNGKNGKNSKTKPNEKTIRNFQETKRKGINSKTKRNEKIIWNFQETKRNGKIQKRNEKTITRSSNETKRNKIGKKRNDITFLKRYFDLLNQSYTISLCFAVARKNKRKLERNMFISQLTLYVKNILELWSLSLAVHSIEWSSSLYRENNINIVF
jgi:hypothetical protein